MAGSKPFMVCSISTKWHGPKTYKTPVRKLSWTPPGTSIEERSSGPRRDPTKQTTRPGCSPTVVPKVDRRRIPPKPTPQRYPDKMTKAQKSLPLSLVPSPDRSLSKKTVVSKPLRTVARSKEGKVIAGCPASLPVTSTKVTPAKQFPPRPSCTPRISTSRSAVDIKIASRKKKRVPLAVSTIDGPGYSSVSQKRSIDVGTARTKTAGRIKVAETIEKAMVAGSCRTGAPIRNRKLTTPRAIARPHAVEFHVTCSQQGSPDLFSSRKIVLDVDVQHLTGPMQICGDEMLSSMSDALSSGVAGTAKGSSGRFEPESDPESILCCPELSPSSTVIDTPESLAGRWDGTVMIGIPTQKLSSKASHMGCDATIISRSGNSTSVVDDCQASQPTKILDTMNRTRMVVCSAVENARAFFSPLRRELHSGTSTETTSKTVAADASRLRKLFIGPLHEDTKASKDPTTEIDTETFRARRQVASDGTVDSRLYHLGALAVMATVLMIRSGSVLDSPGRLN